MVSLIASDDVISLNTYTILVYYLRKFPCHVLNCEYQPLV